MSNTDVSLCLAAVAKAVQRSWLTTEAATRVRQWLTQSAYADWQAAVGNAIQRDEWRVLEECFCGDIPFGTGGRRGPMAPFGAATINPRTIAESAYGLATYLSKSRVARKPLVAIAYDTRLRSREFAEIAARVCVGAGCEVAMFPEPRATPELSFAVRHLYAHAGIMISASHNPPSDNGFKAYWSDGGQVLPPHDRGILEEVLAAGEIPLASERIFDGPGGSSSAGFRWLGTDVDDAYVEAVVALRLNQSENEAPPVRLLFTPLCGVGESSIIAVLKKAGFTDVAIEPTQRIPDGNFAAVPDQLPNPERPLVFEQAMVMADEQGFPLIFATDPDADRLAVAVKTSVGWRCLTGNELGSLLVDYRLRKLLNGPDCPGSCIHLKAAPYVVQTLVTTPLVAALARAAGVETIDRLPVGFKYIGRVVEERGGEGFLFGAEESLGYLAGDYARDKDASIAALWTMELAGELAAQGATLVDRLIELHARFGVHVEIQRTQSSQGATGLARTRTIMQTFRTNPPEETPLEDFSSVNVQWQSGEDCLTSEIWKTAPGDPQPTPIIPTDMVRLTGMVTGDMKDARCGIAVQAAIRPSGTEPKLKLYLAAQGQPGVHERETVMLAISQVADSLIRWMDDIGATA